MSIVLRTLYFTLYRTLALGMGLALALYPAASHAQLSPAVTGQFEPLPSAPKPPAAPPELPKTEDRTLNATPTTPALSATPESTSEGCRPVSDRAMAVDLRAATAQAQKQPLSAQMALYSEAVALWTKAVVACEGRAKERAQRNLNDNQRVKEQLSEQQDAGPKCEGAQKDATTLQDLARQSLTDRRFAEASVLFRKAEDAWDNASELCTGNQQELAEKRRDQSAVDGHNAEFCAPVYERAREQTQKFRNLPSTLAREEKQEQSLIAETLWRDAMAQCKGAVVDAARNQAQALARERGTPWVARNLPPLVVANASKKAAPGTGAAAGPGTAIAAAAPGTGKTTTGKEPSGSGAMTSLTSTLSSFGASVASLANTSAAAAPAAAAGVPATPFKTGVAQAQPPEFVSGTTQFSGKFVRDADGTSFSGTGKITWTNGDVYDGTLVQGQRQGKGLFIWANGQRYEGDWVQDTPSGKGRLLFANGNRFEGDVVAGIPQGTGRMQYASGDDYNGRFNAGVPDGRGLYTWKNGQTFDGEWKAERPNGQGILKFANGNVFEGSVVNGVPNGQGKLTFAAGGLYTGAVTQGEPEGQGSFNWPNGDQYVGLWKAGKKHGEGVFTWKSGERWEGVYENDMQK